MKGVVLEERVGLLDYCLNELTIIAEGCDTICFIQCTLEKRGGQSYLVFEYVILIKLIDFTKAYEALF